MNRPRPTRALNADPLPSSQLPARPRVASRRPWSTVAASAVATGVVALAMAGGFHALGVGSAADHVSDPQSRRVQFAALGALELNAVAPADTEAALDTMPLPAASREALQRALASPLPAAGSPPVRLAWVSLWDTNAEDGDVVRIESQGYARTVRLTKAPQRIAIPVPPSGVVNVVGVKDGEGGGITVGLASGGRQAIFPIMSEGQVLGLKVRLP
jgi:hypothetical protein